MSDTRPKVAIACQGGGSHTAFTAGVLGRLLREPREYDVVGFSGTSGGAICSLLAWYGHLHDDHRPEDLLLDFWADLAARNPIDRASNAAVQWGARFRKAGFALPEVSPRWVPAAAWAQDRLREDLRRHVDFGAIPDLVGDDSPALLVSAIDVRSGEFRIFREDEMSADAVLASAAEPALFDAVEVDGRDYWDGLFSKNPPLVDFSVEEGVADPDEIWLVKINPQERARVPRSLNGIIDRRNELSGNLSLNSEVRFIQRINRWIAAGYLPEEYTHTDVHRIRLNRELDWTTKLDRSPAFLQSLIREGREKADAFLDDR